MSTSIPALFGRISTQSGRVFGHFPYLIHLNNFLFGVNKRLFIPLKSIFGHLDLYRIDEKIKFSDIPKIIKKTMDAHETISDPDLDAILDAEKWAEAYAGKLVGKDE